MQPAGIVATMDATRKCTGKFSRAVDIRISFFRPDRVEGHFAARSVLPFRCTEFFVCHGSEHEMTVPVQVELLEIIGRAPRSFQCHSTIGASRIRAIFPQGQPPRLKSVGIERQSAESPRAGSSNLFFGFLRDDMNVHGGDSPQESVNCRQVEILSPSCTAARPKITW